ncbi:hypothetical protein [Actinospica robiniae]|uniref:hypothetical protein n=1 Tax=Actinospica robiniae TaxID=304901 RepID=UPI0012F7D6D7|nr:hypothetical protein [Actinospica robiniae]
MRVLSLDLLPDGRYRLAVDEPQRVGKSLALAYRFPEVVLSAAELHVLYCVVATPRLMITSERAFWERFGFYRETASTAYFGLVRVAGELDAEPSPTAGTMSA